MQARDIDVDQVTRKICSLLEPLVRQEKMLMNLDGVESIFTRTTEAKVCLNDHHPVCIVM